MISENSTPSTQAMAFSWFAFFGNVGIFTGTLLGGLADPANHYPSVFGKIQLFLDYPYALPTLIGGGLVFLGVIASVFFVQEVSSGKQ